jgi:hypothetical protein
MARQVVRYANSKKIVDEISSSMADMGLGDEQTERGEDVGPRDRGGLTGTERARVASESINPSRWGNAKERAGAARQQGSGAVNVARKGNVIHPQIFPTLQGTHLAAVLHEARDVFGKHDPELAGLADRAIRGDFRGDAFNRIRDRFLALENRGGDVGKLAGMRARSYNWHRVEHGIKTDQQVSNYINSISKDKLKSADSQMRAAHNLFGLGERAEELSSPSARGAFWRGLRGHLEKHGIKATDEMLGKSIRRLAEAEENRNRLAPHGSRTKIGYVPPQNPAWTQKTTGISAKPKALAGQYRRLVRLMK